MLRTAAKEAKRSLCNNFRHGAAIAKGKRILGTGCNIYKTHPTWGGGPLNTLHAEAAAIRDAVRKNINLAGATIFVVRANAGSQMSRPCKYCMKLIEQYGITKIVYTDTVGKVITEYP